MFENYKNARYKYNYRMLFKKNNLNKEVRKAINIISKLINKNQEEIVILTFIIYNFSEKKLYTKKKVKNEILTNENSDEILSNKTTKILSNKNKVALNIINNIKNVYFNDVIFQKIINSKRNSDKRISINITKNKIKLKLRNCDIRKKLLYIKNRIYILVNEKLQVTILQLIHENSLKKHVNKAITYNRINKYYF